MGYSQQTAHTSSRFQRKLGGKKSKRCTIRLACIGTTLLVLYVIFIYTIHVTLDGGHDDNLDAVDSPSSNLRSITEVEEVSEGISVKNAPAAVEAKKDLTTKDFCGMCLWKGQGFNCHERVEWLMKKKGLAKEEAMQTELNFCVDKDGCNPDNKDENGFLICDAQGGTSDTPDTPPSDYKVGTRAHVEKEPELEAILSGSLLAQASLRDIAIPQPNSGGELGNPDEVGLRDRRSGDKLVESVLTAAKHGDHQYDTASPPDGGGFYTPTQEGGGGRSADMPVLTAYCEPVNQTKWETRPLPTRDGPTTKRSLFPVPYPLVNSCKALPSQWPINTPPVDLDPFLPWIHDVFPSSDGKNVVFVAQNRRRCYNGQRLLRRGESLPKGVIGHKDMIHIDYRKNYFMRPQSALFQHVPVKRIASDDPDGEDMSEPRYRLASHKEADADGMETRFICRFKSYDPNATPKMSIVGYSLSRHIVDYDYHTFRKGYSTSATEAGFDNHMIWQSQLLFNCPVPPAYHEKVRGGDTVLHDYANLYVDLVPIRTPPRYTSPREFLQPRHHFTNQIQHLFSADIEWGKNHVLPKIDESGRWENIPICMPTLMSHGLVPKGVDVNTRTIPENESDKKYVAFTGEHPPKIHKVIACTWASTTFRTRSNRGQVSDGKRRLQEWLEFNLLAGFDHIYVYDNSGAFTNEDSLADIVKLFGPEKVTRVDWPCKICSNRDGNEGERSSQYAAESSCRLRFGAHARWLGSFDTDEYLVPMGEHSSMGDVADDLDSKDVKVATFQSHPAKPRFDLLENPQKTADDGGISFTPTVTDNETFLHTYNCNVEAFPRKNDFSHRRKQMYRADYVKLHYVHYSTITVVSQMTEKETKQFGIPWYHRYREQHAHEFDELNESTMLHTKTKLRKNTAEWKKYCKQSFGACDIGFPFPKGQRNFGNEPRGGYRPNCFVNEKIEDFWWPKLADAVKRREKHII